MTQPWHDLPNAALIDRILADVQARPDVWDAAWVGAWTSVRHTVRAAAGAAAWATAVMVSRDTAWTPSMVARDAILALTAWDDCAHLLSTDSEQVRLLALLGHQPAILLYPACVVLQNQWDQT